MVNKQNILFIVQLPPPVHGVTTINKMIINSATINKHYEVKVVPLLFSEDIKEIGKGSIIKYLKLIFVIMKVILTLMGKIDLVFFTITPVGKGFYRDLLIVLILKIFRKKIVFHVHGKGIKDAFNNLLINKILYKYVFNKSYIICLSNELQKDLNNINNIKTYILNNAVRSLKINSFPKDNELITILFVSNLSISKGILLFLDIIKALHELKYLFAVKIIGGEKEIDREYLTGYIKANNLSNIVTYTGPLYNGEKEEKYQNADILIYPSLNDAFPLVILEAMSNSLAVIASDQGAIPELITHGVDGFIVPTGKKEDFIQRAIELIKNPELRKSFQTNAREKFINNYTWDIYENKLLNVLDDILQK